MIIYLVSFVILGLSVNLICSTVPGITVLLFILIIISLSCLLFFLSLEFFAFILFYIYIGGIMVMFIFFIMMLGDTYPTNYNKQINLEPKSYYKHRLFILNSILLMIYFISFFLIQVLNQNQNCENTYTFFLSNVVVYNDITIISYTLFNFFFVDLFLVGFLLLVAMIGPINLILYLSDNFRQQKSATQINRGSLQYVILYN